MVPPPAARTTSPLKLTPAPAVLTSSVPLSVIVVPAVTLCAPVVNTDEGPKPTWTTEAEDFTLMRYVLHEAAARSGVSGRVKSSSSAAVRWLIASAFAECCTACCPAKWRYSMAFSVLGLRR